LVFDVLEGEKKKLIGVVVLFYLLSNAGDQGAYSAQSTPAIVVALLMIVEELYYPKLYFTSSVPESSGTQN
jgi:hypothetical protein